MFTKWLRRIWAAMRRDPVFIGVQIAGVGAAFPITAAGVDATEKGGS
jgi:hypothetical protein